MEIYIYLVRTEKVQHSAFRGSSHRRIVASSNIFFNMIWLYRSPIAVGREWVFYLPMVVSTCLRGCSRRGRGEKAPCGWRILVQTLLDCAGVYRVSLYPSTDSLPSNTHSSLNPLPSNAGQLICDYSQHHSYTFGTETTSNRIGLYLPLWWVYINQVPPLNGGNKDDLNFIPLRCSLRSKSNGVPGPVIGQ